MHVATLTRAWPRMTELPEEQRTIGSASLSIRRQVTQLIRTGPDMITVHQAAQIAFDNASDPDAWSSIVINKRKPHTFRSFLQHEDSRICLHRFEPCEPDDALAHPHPWSSSMLILAGTYGMSVARSADLVSNETSPVINATLSAGSVYTWMIVTLGTKSSRELVATV